MFLPTIELRGRGGGEEEDALRKEALEYWRGREVLRGGGVYYNWRRKWPVIERTGSECSTLFSSVNGSDFVLGEACFGERYGPRGWQATVTFIYMNVVLVNDYVRKSLNRYIELPSYLKIPGQRYVLIFCRPKRVVII